MALCVQWHDIRRVLLHGKHLTEWNAAARFQELNEVSFLLRDFARVFDRRARAFVRPARQRLPEMRSEDRVRYLMRQHGVQNPLARPLNVHLPIEHFTAIENEARCATGTRFELRVNWARLRPSR